MQYFQITLIVPLHSVHMKPIQVFILEGISAHKVETECSCFMQRAVIPHQKDDFINCILIKEAEHKNVVLHNTGDLLLLCQVQHLVRTSFLLAKQALQEHWTLTTSDIVFYTELPQTQQCPLPHGPQGVTFFALFIYFTILIIQSVVVLLWQSLKKDVLFCRGLATHYFPK